MCSPGQLLLPSSLLSWARSHEPCVKNELEVMVLLNEQTDVRDTATLSCCWGSQWGSQCILQDRVQEEELGPVPSLPDGDGPDLHPRDRQGCAAHPGQEMLCQGLFCETKSNLFTLENTLREKL